jgi:thiosulfate/3-mercaptopyruvate sulfurtransferase
MPENEVILYGDFNNWFAAFVFWVFKYYGHKNVKIMNGGRKKWEIEKKPYAKEESNISKTN